MANNNIAALPFMPGENAISLVKHSHKVQSGTLVTLVQPWYGNLCAVLLPNGEIHRWFAWFELKAQNANHSLEPGSYATVISVIGHGKPPHVPVGTTVRIVRCMPTTFYDVTLSDGEYHRWLAEFELAKPFINKF